MKTLKKIVAILAVAMMLCSILPLSAFAADAETIKVTANTGVLSGTTSISWSGTNYEVVNDMDNSSTAIRTSDTDHFRLYIGNEFYVRGKDGALMSQVVIKCTGSSYLISNTSNIVDAGWTVSANGTTVTYTAAEPSAELHISIGKQSRVSEVTITPAVASNPECDHDSLTCGETCAVCSETKEHVYDNNCDADCANGCGITNPNYADHVYDGDYDVDCNLCGETREVTHNVIAVEAKAATCSAEGNIAYWYCDVCGMAWLDAECTLNTNLKAVVLPATGEHTYFDACSAICEVCGYEREVSHNVIHVEAVAATCVANGNIEYWYCDVCGMAWLNAECTLNTNLRAVITPATGEHTYDDEYDADCNICGDVREVPEEPVDEIIYGDANGDGEVNLLDEVLLAQYNAEWDVILDELAADANGDGEVNLLDEVLLAQYNAEWDVVLGPEEEPEQGPLYNDGVLSEW